MVIERETGDDARWVGAAHDAIKGSKPLTKSRCKVRLVVVPPDSLS